MKAFNLVKLTAEFCNNTGTYSPSSRHNIHQRISHKASPSASLYGTHILNTRMDLNKNWTKADKKNDYEFRCLEKGIRPFGYLDNLWEEYLNEVAHEEHSAKCEAKNAWRYQF